MLAVVAVMHHLLAGDYDARSGADGNQRGNSI
jgi:hypothetical protein